MQLPEDLQHFSVPTIILLADHVQAKFWLAGGDALEPLDGVSFPRENKQDNEGSFVDTDSGSVSGPESKAEIERRHQLVHRIDEHLSDLIRKHKAEAIDLVMNAELAHAVAEHLPPDVAGKIQRQLHQDLMKDDILDVLRRLRTPLPI